MNKFSKYYFLILLFCALPAYANPYMPLIEGTTSTANYSFEVKTERKEFKQADTKGSIKIHSKNWEDRNGRRYLKMITSYEGISFMKEESALWRREENGNIYMASDIRGVFSESLELPSNLEVGSEWNYNDGVESMRKVTAKTDLQLPNGEKLSDCIEVTRLVLKNDALKNIKDKTIYCKGRGNVSTSFVQPSPVGDYITETIQSSFKSGASG